jgi:hypothetical protein
MQELQLQNHLHQRGLSVNGRKDELIKRLKEEEKCGTVAHDKGNKQQKNLAPSSTALGSKYSIAPSSAALLMSPREIRRILLARAQPAASSSAIGSTIGDTSSSTPSTVTKVRKAKKNVHSIFVPTFPFGAVSAVEILISQSFLKMR